MQAAPDRNLHAWRAHRLRRVRGHRMQGELQRWLSRQRSCAGDRDNRRYGDGEPLPQGRELEQAGGFEPLNRAQTSTARHPCAPATLGVTPCPLNLPKVQRQEVACCLRAKENGRFPAPVSRFPYRIAAMRSPHELTALLLALPSTWV